MTRSTQPSTTLPWTLLLSKCLHHVVKSHQSIVFSLAILGTPPHVRGSDIPGHDLELQIIRAFPQCAIFVEKPISNLDVSDGLRVERVMSERGTLVGVGYMLRYLKGAFKARSLQCQLFTCRLSWTLSAVQKMKYVQFTFTCTRGLSIYFQRNHQRPRSGSNGH